MWIRYQEEGKATRPFSKIRNIDIARPCLHYEIVVYFENILFGFGFKVANNHIDIV